MTLRHHRNATLGARAGSFLAACAVALVSGTPYLYSTYGNQLTTRLNLSGFWSNVVAAGIHYGLFLSGPLMGRLVDLHGPQKMGVVTALLLMTGYAGLSYTYAGVFGRMGFVTAFMFLVLVGMGSQAGYMVAVSTNNHNFHASRGLAMGFPIAGFGLSALLFAQISSSAFPDDTELFLMFVSITIGFTILAAVPLLRIFADGTPDSEQTLAEEAPASVGVGTGIGSVPLLHGEGSNQRSQQHNSRTRASIASTDELLSDAEEEARRRTQEQERLISADSHHYVVKPVAGAPSTPGSSQPSVLSRPLAGFALFRTSREAQLLLLSVLFLAGPSLMYIGNAGNIIRSVYRDRHNDPTAPPSDEELIRLQKLQNYHVSLISLFSCVGRITIGLMSDLGKRGRGSWWGISRVFFLLYAGCCVWLGQSFGAHATMVEQLTKVSVLVGLGYGSMFGVAPTITSEWFGQSTFGTNWGWISLAPALGSQFFTATFGLLYDAEARHEHTKECYGPECYRTAFVLGACSASLGIITILSLALRTKRTSNNLWN